MKLKVVLEPSDEGGYTAYVPSLPGCISEGHTREQAIFNIKEAIELYLEPVEDDLTPSPYTEIMAPLLSPTPRTLTTAACRTCLLL